MVKGEVTPNFDLFSTHPSILIRYMYTSFRNKLKVSLCKGKWLNFQRKFRNYAGKTQS